MKTTQPTELIGSNFVTPADLRMSGNSPNLSPAMTNLDATMTNTGINAASLGKALFGGVNSDFPVKGPNGK